MILPVTHLAAFALVALGMALTPGPNMIYLISRSICQGPRGAGLAGRVALGFVFYMVCAAFGITALVMAVPYAYDALRLGGAAYLLAGVAGDPAWWALAVSGAGAGGGWQSAAVLMGFMTNLLNPKIAVMYLSLLPQFTVPGSSMLAQILMLGTMQIGISVLVNAAIALSGRENGDVS
jgi:threonine/homoserine/homoserine lactone efflux protein